MALKNADRSLTVETSLGQGAEDQDDPLLLLRVSGAEGISMPYAFELTMLGAKDSLIAPDQLIGRPASFGIRKTDFVHGKQEEGHNDRFGVFETFEHLGTLRERRIFRARFVPAFRMTAYEQRFRVFEDRDLVSILREVLEPFPLVDLRTNLLKDLPPTRIPYCVQYNETTFAFVHRLLDRCGVAYRFEHGDDGPNPAGRMRREQMMLSFKDHQPHFVRDAMRVLADDGSAGDAKSAMAGKVVDGVRGFRLGFSAAAQNARVGDFNTIDPKNPAEGLAIITTAYAFSARSIGVRAEAFPAPGVDPKDPDAAARLRMRQNEAASASASGRAYSSSFYAGRQFTTGKDETGAGNEDQDFLLRLVTIDAFDIVDDRGIGTKFLDLLQSVVFGGSDPNDMMGQAAEQLRDKLKGDIDKGTEIYNWLDKKAGASDPSGLPGFIADKIGRAGSGLFAAAAAAVPAIKEIAAIIEGLLKGGSGFACAFEAIPTSAPLNDDHWPTPSATRPVAHGPHYALVVGPKGVDTATQDIATDALGRVRIRFPWDQGPPGKNASTPAPLPLTNDQVTAWVRVAEGWAGSRFGMQFIPRIGQEVLVGFIDGDPERPIIIGRLYNAGSGKTNLPYPSQGVIGRPIEKVEDLPATQNSNTTRSGIRTRSTPNADTAAGFHAIRFDDLKGREQLVIRGEHRLDTTSTGSRYDTTRGSRHTIVGGGKEAADGASGGGDFISIGGERDVTIGDSRYTKIATDDHLMIQGDQLTEVTGNSMVSAGQIVLTAGLIALHAKKKIQLVVGNSMVVITPAGVFTEAAILDHKGASADNPGGVTIKEPLGAAQADPGEPPDFLAQQAQQGGGGGGRKSHGMAVQEGLSVRKGPGRLLRVGGVGDKGVLVDPGKPPDNEFVNQTVSDLQDLHDDPASAPAIEAAEKRTHPVTIKASDPSTVQDPPFASPSDPIAATPAGRQTARGKGTGKGSPTDMVMGEPADGSPEAAAKHHKDVAQVLDDSAGDDTGTSDHAAERAVPHADPAPFDPSDPSQMAPNPHPLPPPPPPPITPSEPFEPAPSPNPLPPPRPPRPPPVTS